MTPITPPEPPSPPSKGIDRSTRLHVAYAILFLGGIVYLLVRWRGH
ncbi:MAG TPA: hypothetical protein VH877_29510 [Polyangia bacterium]|jgi:hypothetical protein|nr:hypothetical protein [Polyangia bacterium]